MKIRNDAIIGVSTALVFSLLYITGVMNFLEGRLYDFFLRFRANRQRIENVVFLDVDDPAIAYNGVFPWPRSISAEGLLRLKEYGSLAGIFDIEYIDHGPQGVDSLYLSQGLGNDFNRSFSDINSAASDVFSAVLSGRINRDDIEYYAHSFYDLVMKEHQDLYGKAQNVARDNDLFLAQAFALNGKVWSTLNLKENLLTGEQAERRSIAEENFAYPVNAAADANTGAGFTDILPALPIFSHAAKGAGYTNVELDSDGVRRRIYLTQNIDGYWYLQLTFAPLVDYFGRPEIILEKNRMIIKQAQLPDGRKKDITIPLDNKGRMMLDWPREDYIDSYDHISFANFSLLDEIEGEIEFYSHALASADLITFSQIDHSLSSALVLLNDLVDYFDAVHELKSYALEFTSNDYFEMYLEYRDRSHSLLRELFAFNLDGKVTELAYSLAEEYPEYAFYLEDEAYYITLLIENLHINIDRWEELNASNDKMLRNKFVIMGRVDTGTTDYGANPFHGKYVNVGTHGVLLDTILSENFIIPLGIWWRIIFMMIFIPLFFILSAGLSPVIRTASGFIITLLIFVGSVFLFRFTGLYWGPLGFVFSMIIAVMLREIISYSASEKEKHFIRSAFSTYVSGDVVKEIISDPSRLQLGGTKRHMTAIFTDVRGFSTISEKLDPEDLVSLLNRYLSAMSDIILEEKGTIDKYEGDAIIAFFGAPLDLKDHALRACVSAIKMKKTETELNKIIIEHNLSSAPLLTRIGINTGNMVAGNMGTDNKMNYTIMGNAVNLAARLEGVNKQYGTWILASEDTIKEAGHHLLYRNLDRVRVVGINEPVRLCELVDTASHADHQKKELVKVFHNALDHFEKREWTMASEGFNEALSINSEDSPSKIFHERCEKFIIKPPADNWDGVYNLTEK